MNSRRSRLAIVIDINLSLFSEKNHHKANKTIRKSPGNCKAAKIEMVRARDKIGRPNQSDITGSS